jgi:hypothetical protein
LLAASSPPRLGSCEGPLTTVAMHFTQIECSKSVAKTIGICCDAAFNHDGP